MTEKKQSKTVSWAPEFKLCQVKLIRKSDPPIKVGQKVRNIPRRKIPPNFPSTCPSAYVPLKKEANVNQSNEKLHKIIPHIMWKIPPALVLESDWFVTSGEESEETKVQKLRESLVPEAVYYPPSPCTHSDIEDQCFEDSQTPIIPIIPSEEADLSPKTLNNMVPPKSFPDPDRSKNSKSDPMEGDALLAAVAAVTTIIRSMNPGSLIDTDLLIKFLKDPDLTLQLINECRFAVNNTNSSVQPKDLEGKSAIEKLTTKTGTGGRSIVELPSKNFVGGQSQVNISSHIISPPPIVTGSVFGANDHHVVRINPLAGNVVAQPDLTVIKRMIRDYGLSDHSERIILSPEPLAVGKENSARPISHSEPFGESWDLLPMKQLSHYQILMKQHGETKKRLDEAHTSTESNTQNIHKPKTQETCVYFNTVKGCRNGSSCLFRHEAFDQPTATATATATSGAPDAKRMKLGLGRELIGRT